MFKNLGELLCKITGFDSVSLQPNAGAAGEYAGLMVIREYHRVFIHFKSLNVLIRRGLMEVDIHMMLSS